MKSSKVLSVSPQASYENQHGTFYPFNVTLENRDAGQYSSKSQDQTKVVVGAVIDYELDLTRPGSPKIKLVQKQGGGSQGGGNFQGGAKRSGYQKEDFSEKSIAMAMSYSKDLVVGGVIKLEQLDEWFSKIYVMMNAKDKVSTTTVSKQATPPPQSGPSFEQYSKESTPPQDQNSYFNDAPPYNEGDWR